MSGLLCICHPYNHQMAIESRANTKTQNKKKAKCNKSINIVSINQRRQNKRSKHVREKRQREDGRIRKRKSGHSSLKWQLNL